MNSKQMKPPYPVEGDCIPDDIYRDLIVALEAPRAFSRRERPDCGDGELSLAQQREAAVMDAHALADAVLAERERRIDQGSVTDEHQS